jgi:hypothetical protein
LIIWDTGEYEVLPYKKEASCPQTDESQADSSDGEILPPEPMSDSAKLQEAFLNVRTLISLPIQGH